MRTAALITAVALSIGTPAIAHQAPRCNDTSASKYTVQQMHYLRFLVRFAGKHTKIDGRVAGKFGFRWHTLYTYGFGNYLMPSLRTGHRFKTFIAIPRDSSSKCVFFGLYYTKQNRRMWVTDSAGKILKTLDVHNSTAFALRNSRLRDELERIRDHYEFYAQPPKYMGLGLTIVAVMTGTPVSAYATGHWTLVG